MEMKALEKIINEKIRPRLQSHDGDVQVIDVVDGIVRVKLTGACSGCPSADLTTRDFIEDELKKNFSWVKEVRIINEISEDLLEMARKILKK
ncbi:MAG: NifU family protein [Eubacteriales bacterium]|nr:NifU family protein [Eubacteriales bacterium]